jgi:hypothetical protein
MSTPATKSKPDRTSKSKAAGRTGKGSKPSAKGASAKAKTAGVKTASKDGGKRLSPGTLDGLVLGYMKRNPKKLPATSGVVGRGIKRSPGAIANCLKRLEKAGKVKLANKKPREYDLISASK